MNRIQKEPKFHEEVTEERSKIMSQIRGKDTSIEIRLRKALWTKGYRYRKNFKILSCTSDIDLTKYKIAVFCDSEFLHGKDWEILKLKLPKGKNAEYWISKFKEIYSVILKKTKNYFWMDGKLFIFGGNDIIKETEECVRVIEKAIYGEYTYDERNRY